MVAIVGWSHSQFGKQPAATVESLLVSAVDAALRHAGVTAEEIDEIFVGHFNAGFSAQDFTAALALQGDPGLRFKPTTRVENACATGSAAVHQGIRAIESRRARRVLVVGAEHMTGCAADAVGRNLLRAAYLPEEQDNHLGFAGVFGRIAAAYMERYGDQSDALALIAAKNHKNGVGNPYAHMRRDLGFEFCREVSERNPRVAGILKRTDCSPVSDGAAALVLTDDELARSMPRAVSFRGISHVQDVMPLAQRDILRFEGCALAWQRGLAAAGLRLDDLSFVETHDCFTIAELLEYEAMGLTAPGRGADAIASGRTTMSGSLPVNPSGGLKAKGHPIGATGVSMHVLTAMQLCAEAPAAIQVRDAKIGGVFNMGGAAVANYVSILERTH
jgi:acetyl-CoA C-acetyltransferase